MLWDTERAKPGVLAFMKLRGALAISKTVVTSPAIVIRIHAEVETTRVLG